MFFKVLYTVEFLQQDDLITVRCKKNQKKIKKFWAVAK
jgi:hypothetical protein